MGTAKQQGGWATFKEVVRPWYIKAVSGAVLFMAAYQFGCDQFGWPTLPKLWNMTGTYIAWWGWLLILQGVFVYALFEYIRRNMPMIAIHGASSKDDVISADIQRLTAVQQTMLDQYPAVIAQQAEEISRLNKSMAGLEKIEDAVQNIPPMQTAIGDMRTVVDRLQKAKEAEATLETIEQTRKRLAHRLDLKPIPLTERRADHRYCQRDTNFDRGFPIFLTSPDAVEKIKPALAAIQNNAVNNTREGDDHLYFRDGADKQAYILEREYGRCWAQIMHKLEEEAKRDAGKR